MVALDRIPSDPAISRHVVHWSLPAELSGTRHSGQVYEERQQAVLRHGVRGILGPPPLFKPSQQPPCHQPAPSGANATRPGDWGTTAKANDGGIAKVPVHRRIPALITAVPDPQPRRGPRPRADLDPAAVAMRAPPPGGGAPPPSSTRWKAAAPRRRQHSMSSPAPQGEGGRRPRPTTSGGGEDHHRQHPHDAWQHRSTSARSHRGRRRDSRGSTRNPPWTQRVQLKPAAPPPSANRRLLTLYS